MFSVVLLGQLQRILEEREKGQHATLSPVLVQRLNAIMLDSKRVADSAMAAVQADDEEYFKNLGFVITKPWTHLKSHRKVVPTLRWEIPIYQTSNKCKFLLYILFFLH